MSPPELKYEGGHWLGYFQVVSALLFLNSPVGGTHLIQRYWTEKCFSFLIDLLTFGGWNHHNLGNELSETSGYMRAELRIFDHQPQDT